MPRYEFECSGCGKKVELILSMADRNSSQVCPECRISMERLLSLPARTSVHLTGRDKVLANLNAKDDGIGNKPHIKNAMWKGLHQRDPVVGRGFGPGKN